ncbi:hypothetical protein Ptr902_07248 [Pyrenophora tritici-repentis]|nr:hypothetical protein Alg215_11387 [Pyrenophora tritici-repentis]KAI0572657.1 hypothetical protein Alg130_10417 [Pyrenophora tritici-repentis]KAI0605378.1 hypothetical protein TUN205_10376 [Pyrenophora tritici-repentis]KAI0617701.1 hypothetical protein TUN199_10308 [Pyrenophora tritici-repentis]KAI2481453.1 hypothetical protein Ptr902_07248 [Pyrenophora tritici-repentis]
MKLFIAIIATALAILPGSKAQATQEICGICYQEGNKLIGWTCFQGNIKRSCNAQCYKEHVDAGKEVCCDIPLCT